MPIQVPQSFENYFAQIYGPRWPTLLQALLENESQVFRINAWSSTPALSGKEVMSGCYLWGDLENRQPQRDSQGLLDGYVMDGGSVVAARALGVEAGDRVLDMCSAPGGKTLILAEQIGEQGELIANELSPARRERLIKVIQQYIPRSRRDNIWVKGIDAVKFGLKEPDSFDKILLDAPCSGERHLLGNPAELKEWSIKRTERLAARQYSLLAGAFLAVKSGGSILYSTCSISPLENDGVIKQLLKKKKDSVNIVDCQDLPGGAEKTEFGWIYLPDKGGFGPLYFCKVQKQ